jgi:ubiquinone/menaquinone biosynthesis C-methylase UbiE
MEGAGTMRAVLKIDLDERLRSGDPIVLELGCGARRREGRIGIDKLDLPSVDIVADVEEGLPFLPNDSVDEIHSKSFLEHIRNFEQLMREMVRVLKPGGRAHIFVPHFSNPYFYSDPTHVRFFGLYTFQYFAVENRQFRRGVPRFYTDCRVRIVSHELLFQSPFRRRNRVKRLIGRLVNLHRATQEFYEENLCWLFPCYALKVVLTPDK